jgi:sugar porter (SP) family MFS transporter
MFCWQLFTNRGQGIVTAMYQIGSVVAIPFIGPAIDTWGRRAGMFIAASIIVIGVIIQGTCIATENIGQFMGGRFLLGFGVGIIGSAGPCYVVEISHPAHRGVVTGLYNVFWPVGALVAAGAARGGLNYTGNTTWLIPVWMQAMFPGIVVLFAWFLPESPRWNYVHGKVAEAKKTLVKYHGEGNPDSEWVKLQMSEYEQHLELDGTDKRWWDYRALFKDRASRYRLMSNCLISLFGQWAGNGIVSYFLSFFFTTAGIRGEVLKTNLQLGMNAIQITFAALGATMVDRFGRRPMLIVVNIVCSLCWVCITVATSIANIDGNSTPEQVDNVPGSVSRAVLAWVYIFQICYSVGWTPMQALYPVEVLSFEMRAKGMAFSNLFVSIGLLANQFGVSVALERIAWRTYIVFTVWCAIQAVIIYFFIPETKNRTVSCIHRNSLSLPNTFLQYHAARGTRRHLPSQEPPQGFHREEEVGGRRWRQCRSCRCCLRASFKWVENVGSFDWERCVEGGDAGVGVVEIILYECDYSILIRKFSSNRPLL